MKVPFADFKPMHDELKKELKALKTCYGLESRKAFQPTKR